MSGIGKDVPRFLSHAQSIFARACETRVTPPGRVACAAMFEALLWGAIAASSLVIGGVLGLLRDWPQRLVGCVLAFGAGALISAVSFDLFEEGQKLGGRCRWRPGSRPGR